MIELYMSSVSKDARLSDDASNVCTNLESSLRDSACGPEANSGSTLAVGACPESTKKYESSSMRPLSDPHLIAKIACDTAENGLGIKFEKFENSTFEAEKTGCPKWVGVQRCRERVSGGSPKYTPV